MVEERGRGGGAERHVVKRRVVERSEELEGAAGEGAAGLILFPHKNASRAPCWRAHVLEACLSLRLAHRSTSLLRTS